MVGGILVLVIGVLVARHTVNVKEADHTRYTTLMNNKIKCPGCQVGFMMNRRRFISSIASLLGLAVTLPHPDEYICTGMELSDLPPPVLPRSRLHDLYFSPEALEDIKNWTVDIDEKTKQAIYSNGC